MIQKIPVEPYKQHQGIGSQLSYKGVALTPPVQEVIVKVNEIIDLIQDFEIMASELGMSVSSKVETGERATGF